jgi:RND family efflux transporter MFP subunit
MRLWILQSDISSQRPVLLVRFGIRTCFLFLFFSIVGLVIGCRPKPNPVVQNAPLIIPVSHPVERKVTDYMDYPGRTNAIQSVSIRARASGYLTKLHFTEGAEVQEKDLLLEIDPRPYQALVDQAKSQLVLSQAQLKLAKITLERDIGVLSTGAVSQQQIDQDRASVEVAEARIKNAQAALDAANLNLSFTKVTAPISGRVSRYYYTVGNMVVQDQTLLTTIVSMDPIYAYFDMDDRTYHRLVKNINEGKSQMPSEKSRDQVLMALDGEEGFPHKGKIDFINNQVNSTTGTISVRGVFENPRPKGGIWALAPGMFVRMRLPLGEPYPALLVIDRAIGSDQGLKFVYVVDAENKIQYRRVITGALQEDGLRVIEPWNEKANTGVNPTDWVVVGGLPQLRPRTVIQPDPISMPVMTNNDAPTPSRERPQPPPPGGKKNGPKKDL